MGDWVKYNNAECNVMTHNNVIWQWICIELKNDFNATQLILHSAEIHVIHWWMRKFVCVRHFSFTTMATLFRSSSIQFCIWHLRYCLLFPFLFRIHSHSLSLPLTVVGSPSRNALLHTHTHTHFITLWKCGMAPSSMPKTSVFKRALMG